MWGRPHSPHGGLAPRTDTGEVGEHETNVRLFTRFGPLAALTPRIATSLTP